MPDLYDYGDIYDITFSEAKSEFLKKHYAKAFEGRTLSTILDCSFGTGNLTICLAEMGYRVTGSDISESMLAQGRKTIGKKGLDIPLFQCDFRELSKTFSEKFDCVMTTGNALAHVSNDDAVKTLREMDKLVQPGGYLYLDSRNWEKILRDRNRFLAYPPVFQGDIRVNVVQLWDYLADGTMDFNLMYTFERENKIERKEVFTEHYYPLPLSIITDTLLELGYSDLQLRPHPDCFPKELKFEEMGWYYLLAQKPITR